jgi:signal transduction histidine kinase
MLNAMIQSTAYYKNLEAEISRSATDACDNLMSEMGAEIHDDIVQKLSSMKLYIEQLERFSSLDPDLETILVSMRAEYEQISQSLKRISRQLMPNSMENESFSTTVELLCQNMENTRSANIHFNQEGFERPVPHTQSAHLYRIVQELLHNAFKHSFAWHVWVTLSWGSTRLIMEVEDDGTGVNDLANLLTHFRQKRNTLKMRCDRLGGSINYLKGKRGLVARIEVSVPGPA